MFGICSGPVLATALPARPERARIAERIAATTINDVDE
jgi:hypothetical protein